MPSEVKRGFIRVASNYVRLLSAVVLGLVLVRLLLQGITEDGYAVVALFGSTVGLAAMVQEIVRASMIRELGAAYHSGDNQHFLTTYNSAFGLTAIAAILVSILFAILWFCVPLFNLQSSTSEWNMTRGAYSLVAARGIETFLIIICAPAINMYLVSERLVLHNLFQLLMKPVTLSACALWIAFYANPANAVEGLVMFAWSSALVTASIMVFALLLILVIDKRLIPRPSFIRIEAIKSVINVGAWNAAVVTAQALYFRIDAIIMNITFGLPGSQIFGYTLQLSNSARRLVVGMTDGLDAVSARLSSTDDEYTLKKLVHHATVLHGMVAFPAALAVASLAEPFLHIWVANKLADPEAIIPHTVLLIQVLIFGVVIRGICDGWMRILYGAGHIKRYAPFVIIGGALNPILVITLLWLIPEGTTRFLIVGIVFSSLMFILHGILIPRICANALGMTFKEMLSPLLRPLITTALCTPILLAYRTYTENWTLITLFAAALSFGFVYAIASWIITLRPKDRHLLINAAKRRLPFLKV